MAARSRREMNSVFDLLESDHKEINDLLHRAREVIFLSDREYVYAAVDMVWARLAVHIRAEHIRLFPALIGAGADEKILDGLRNDHASFMNALGQVIKNLTGDPVGKIESGEMILAILDNVENRLLEHNELEERLIYPITLCFEKADAIRLYDEIKRELDNIPPRFKR
jgi:hemerythrin superfamily protein